MLSGEDLDVSRCFFSHQLKKIVYEPTITLKSFLSLENVNFGVGGRDLMGRICSDILDKGNANKL